MSSPRQADWKQGMSVATEAAGGDTLHMDGPVDFTEGRALVGSPLALEPGSLFASRYKIERELGHGGFGVVYLAFDDSPLQRRVALKLIRLAQASDADSIRRAKKQFLAEAKLAGGLSHPNVTTIYDIGELDGNFYLTQELVEGHDLSELLLEKPAGLPEEQVRELATQICDGLAHAHSRGVVHRDIKPANILLAGSGQIKITDFGLAYAPLSQGTSAIGMVVGTPGYMAPEQFEGRLVDARADVFAAGCVIYHMLTGKIPFQGNSLAEVAARTLGAMPLAPSLCTEGVSQNWDRVIERALAKSPQERFASVDELRSALLDDTPVQGLVDPAVAAQTLLSGSGLSDCVVFVGRQLPLSQSEHRSLEGHLRQQLTGQSDGEDCNLELSVLAQGLQSDLGREAMLEHLSVANRSDILSGDRVASSVASLPVPLVVTTRYDSGLSEAMGRASVEFDQYTGRTWPAQLPDTRMLVHLFGLGQEKEDLVVTEDDLWDFYGEVHSQLGGMRACLANKKLLFVGFCPSEKSFRQLCQHIAQCRSDRGEPCYLICPTPSLEAIRWAERKGIHVVMDQAERFLGRLGQGGQHQSFQSLAHASTNLKKPELETSPALEVAHSLGFVGTLLSSEQPPSVVPGPAGHLMRWAARSVVAIGIFGAALSGYIQHFEVQGEESVLCQGANCPEKAAQEAAMPAVLPEPESITRSFVVYVASINGSNEAALEQGRVLQSLLERSLTSTFSEGDTVEILSGSAAYSPTNSAQARQVGLKAGATIVLWGDTLSFRGATEYQPYITWVDDEHLSEKLELEGFQVRSGDGALDAYRQAAEDVAQLVLLTAGQHWVSVDPKLALEYFDQIQPVSADSLAAQADALLRQGLFVEAERRAQLALDLDSEHAGAWAKLGWLKWFQGFAPEALLATQRSVEYDGNDVSRRMQYARMLMQQNQYVEALNQMKVARSLAPDDRQIYWAIMETYLQEGELDEARAFASSVRLTEGGEQLYRRSIWLIMATEGRISEVEAELRALLLTSPDKTDLHADLGMALFRSHRFEEAIPHLKRAMGPGELHKTIAFYLLRCYETLERLEEASSFLGQAISRESVSWEVYFSAARLYSRMGRYEDGLEMLRLGLGQAPPISSAIKFHEMWGGMHAMVGDYESAEQDFLRAQRLVPEQGVQYVNLGILYEEWGRWEDAIEMYKTSSKLNGLQYYSALFWYYAAIRHGFDTTEVSDLIRSNIGEQNKKVQYLKWVTLINRHAIGDLSDEQLLAEGVNHQVEQGVSLEEQESWYYVGMRARAEGRLGEAQYWLDKVTQGDAGALFEHRTARAEMKRLNTQLGPIEP